MTASTAEQVVAAANEVVAAHNAAEFTKTYVAYAAAAVNGTVEVPDEARVTWIALLDFANPN